MKLLIVIFLALAVQSIVGTFADTLDEIFRQSSDYDAGKLLDDILKAAAIEPNSQWQSQASRLPDAAMYKTKVTNRIENSYILSRMPHLKERLYKMAEQKLENCLTPDGQGLDKGCVGRSKGFMMQIISATEKSGSDIAYTLNMRYY